MNSPEAEPVAYPVLEAGVDWLTCTCAQGDTQEEFDDAGYRLLQWERSEGVECKPWRMAGFEGLNCGGVAFGKRDELSIMRLSSKLAWSNWHRVYQLATGCSRIDLQVTIGEVPDANEMILAYHKAALDHIADWKRPPQVDLRLSNRSSPTLYLNKRISDRFGRVYDKWDESKLDHYKNTVRFETQFNNGAALAMSTTLAQKPIAPAAVLPYVAHFFTVRGVRPRWSEATELQLCCPRKRSDSERHLEWIRRQVAPGVMKLVQAGRIADVVAALGLSEFLTVTAETLDGP